MLDGPPPRVAIFTGNDSIGREKMKGAVVAAIYRQGGEVAEERFDSTVESFDEFATRMITPSLFGSTRIFHVRHANQLSDEELAELARMLRYDLPDIYLIVEVDEKLPKKESTAQYLKTLGAKALVKKEGGRAAIFEFEKPPDYRIAQWLTDLVPRLFGRRISKGDAEFLVECVGSELDTLYSELQKIDIDLAPKAPIDRAAIESISGANRTPTAFELAGALGDRDLSRALDILDSLFASSFYAPVCVAAIFRHFWRLFRIRAWAKTHAESVKRYLSIAGRYEEREAQNRLAHEIGVGAGLLSPDDPVKKAYPVVVLSKAVQQARTFSDEQLRSIFEWLRRYDEDVKTGKVEANKPTFQLLCYKIARAGEFEMSGGV